MLTERGGGRLRVALGCCGKGCAVAPKGCRELRGVTGRACGRTGMRRRIKKPPLRRGL